MALIQRGNDFMKTQTRLITFRIVVSLILFLSLLPSEFIDTIETLLTTNSWWDTVDTLASHTVGTHFRRSPEIKELTLSKWRKSENIWLRRTCLLFQLNYKEETDFDLLGGIILENLGQKEFFINKAIGWALREYSKSNPEWVRNYLAGHQLQLLSVREASKYL
jgi:3-methyladenine DNA glycosylase AlkD